MSQTANGALTLHATGVPLVDLNFQTVRGITQERVWELMANAWNTGFDSTLLDDDGVSATPSTGSESSTAGLIQARTYVLRCLCHLRDIRNDGKGERAAWFHAFEWLVAFEPLVAATFIEKGRLEEFGSWRDVVQVATFQPTFDDDTAPFVSQSQRLTTLHVTPPVDVGVTPPKVDDIVTSTPAKPATVTPKITYKQVLATGDTTTPTVGVKRVQTYKEVVSSRWRHVNKVATQHLLGQLVIDATTYWKWRIETHLLASAGGGDVTTDSVTPDTATPVASKPPSISLVAKWLPSEGCHFDLQCSGLHAKRWLTNFASMFGKKGVTALFKPPTAKKETCPVAVALASKEESTAVTTVKGNDFITIGGSKADFRVSVLTPLRAHLDIVERLISAGQWDQINFSKVPAKAFQNLKEKFTEKCKDRFAAHVNAAKETAQKVQSGEVKAEDVDKKAPKINTGAVHPHEILKPYFQHCGTSHDQGARYQHSLQDAQRQLQQVQRAVYTLPPCEDRYRHWGWGRTVTATPCNCGSCKLGRASPAEQLAHRTAWEANQVNVIELTAAAVAVAQTDYDTYLATGVDYATDPRYDAATEASWVTFVSKVKTDLRAATRKRLVRTGSHTATAVAAMTDLEIDALTPHLLTLSDLSGSMASAAGSVPPMHVSITLGLLSAELGYHKVDATGTYGYWMNFSDTPTLQHVRLYTPDGTPTTLLEKVATMDNRNWGGSTNLQAGFEAIFDLALQQVQRFVATPPVTVPTAGLHHHLLPETFVIISDMQFNTACPGNCHTNLEAIQGKLATLKMNVATALAPMMTPDHPCKDYATSWLAHFQTVQAPTIVFWNVSATGSDVPASADETGVVLASGFNPSLFKQILEVDVTSFNPLKFLVALLEKDHLKVINYAQ
jgi:hypothetical protein